MPANSITHRAATEALEVPVLRILSSSVTESERIAFIKKHIRAIELVGRRTIQHAWLVGRELAYIKEQRADLRGRAWVAFLKKNFALGERQAFDIMRVNRAFPSMKSFPKGIESVRGAIAHLQAQQEVQQAEGRTAGRPRTCRRSTVYADERQTEPRRSSNGTESYQPFAALPSSARTREQLRTAQQQLAEIAASDAAAFGKVRDVIRRQHARIRSKSIRTSTKSR